MEDEYKWAQKTLNALYLELPIAVASEYIPKLKRKLELDRAELTRLRDANGSYVLQIARLQTDVDCVTDERDKLAKLVGIDLARENMNLEIQNARLRKALQAIADSRAAKNSYRLGLREITDIARKALEGV